MLFEQFSHYPQKISLAYLYPYVHINIQKRVGAIEGVKFILDEAGDVVFSGRIIHGKLKNCHDLQTHINVSNNVSEMMRTPESTESFLRY